MLFLRLVLDMVGCRFPVFNPKFRSSAICILSELNPFCTVLLYAGGLLRCRKTEGTYLGEGNTKYLVLFGQSMPISPIIG